MLRARARWNLPSHRWYGDVYDFSIDMCAKITQMMGLRTDPPTHGRVTPTPRTDPNTSTALLLETALIMEIIRYALGLL